MASKEQDKEFGVKLKKTTLARAQSASPRKRILRFLLYHFVAYEEETRQPKSSQWRFSRCKKQKYRIDASVTEKAE